jgi:hypothetical protein
MEDEQKSPAEELAAVAQQLAQLSAVARELAKAAFFGYEPANDDLPAEAPDRPH